MVYQWQALVSVADWGDELVLYDRQSGETHLFSGASKDILTFSLSQRRFNIPNLIDNVKERFEDLQGTETFVVSTLESLIHKKLISIEK
ncbi:hypothetical protein [Methylomonas albis]|uniref:PqqD family protein n=1 Tax=Methylomonas albis TaxID=1854563 RepID=A0ABR9D3T1_9GAMM|nr:hypothetical protein [Methylomonas albis]MBD9357768.1 hypothetical protein [Methylomonas albis]